MSSPAPALRSPLERMLEWTAGLPARQTVPGLAAAWAVVVLLDAATGRLVSLNTLYLVPLCFTAWCLGGGWGLVSGVLAVATTLAINGFGDGLSAQASHVPTGIAIWNAAMRIAGVGFLILLVGAFRRTFDRAHDQARIDPLTGLGNRRAFAIESRQIARQARGLLYGLIDLDDFKRINDVHGHATGDEILCVAAGALRGALRPGDATARIGGDELAFCLAADDGCAEARVADIHHRVATALAGARVPATCSLGAALSHEPGVAFALAAADRAMYAAKRHGKDQWRFVA